MSFHWLVDVERCEALDVKASQPHGADDCYTERMTRIFKRCLYVDAFSIRGFETLLHPGAVRDDVEIPFSEIADLVLRFADDDLDDRLFDPARPLFQLFTTRWFRLGVGRQTDLGRFRLPARNDALINTRARELVDTNQ